MEKHHVDILTMSLNRHMAASCVTFNTAFKNNDCTTIIVKPVVLRQEVFTHLNKLKENKIKIHASRKKLCFHDSIAQ